MTTATTREVAAPFVLAEFDLDRTTTADERRRLVAAIWDGRRVIGLFGKCPDQHLIVREILIAVAFLAAEGNDERTNFALWWLERATGTARAALEGAIDRAPPVPEFMAQLPFLGFAEARGPGLRFRCPRCERESGG